MSETSLALVRGLFERASQHAGGRKLDVLNQESRTAMFDSLDPDIEFHEDPRFPEAGVHRGIEAVRSYLGRFTESFDEFSFEAEDFVDLLGDRVLVLLRLTTRGKGSGAKVEVSPGWIVTVRNGLVVRVDAFLDRDEALKAAGLSE